jgi:hypothetical protein
MRRPQPAHHLPSTAAACVALALAVTSATAAARPRLTEPHFAGIHQALRYIDDRLTRHRSERFLTEDVVWAVGQGSHASYLRTRLPIDVVVGGRQRYFALVRLGVGAGGLTAKPLPRRLAFSHDLATLPTSRRTAAGHVTLANGYPIATFVFTKSIDTVPVATTIPYDPINTIGGGGWSQCTRPASTPQNSHPKEVCSFG